MRHTNMRQDRSNSLNVSSPVLVFDVGGSHVAAARCYSPGYRLGSVISAPHPSEPCSDAFIQLLHSIGMSASNGAAHISGAQLAVPGPFDLEAGISKMQHKLPYLYGVNLRQELAKWFGWQPRQIRFLNDADAFLLGEIGSGAARAATRAIGITLGTGIGSAFAVDGHVITSGDGVPPKGEIWNLPYENGIVEDLISARGIQNHYRSRTGSLCEVARLALMADKNSAAHESFVVFGHHLGCVLHELLSRFPADVVVLGGGISRSAHLFLPTANSQIRDMNVRLTVSEHIEDISLVGAAVAWFANSSPNNAERDVFADQPPTR